MAGSVTAAQTTFDESTVRGSVFAPQVYTVSTLPGTTNFAGTPQPPTGSRAFVSDATASTFAASLTGGGLFNIPVYFNGSFWIAG